MSRHTDTATATQTHRHRHRHTDTDTDTQSLKRRNKRADHGRILKKKETAQTWRRSSSATALLVLLLGTSIGLSIRTSTLPWLIHPWIYKLSFANNYDLFLCSHLEDTWHLPPPSSDAVTSFFTLWVLSHFSSFLASARGLRIRLFKIPPG